MGYAFLKLAWFSNKDVTDRIPINSDEVFVSESVLGVFFGARSDLPVWKKRQLCVNNHNLCCCVKLSIVCTLSMRLWNHIFVVLRTHENMLLWMCVRLWMFSTHSMTHSMCIFYSTRAVNTDWMTDHLTSLLLYSSWGPQILAARNRTEKTSFFSFFLFLHCCFFVLFFCREAW